MADDAGGFDSWEEQEDSGMLDKRIGEMKLDTSPAGDKSGSKIVVKEDSARTEYAPQVRILKRDRTADEQLQSNKTVIPVSKPTKTLEEREAEYAEARLRIFGCEPEPEPEEEPSESRPIRLINKVEEPPANIVIRQPRGPDGTKGFNIER